MTEAINGICIIGGLAILVLSMCFIVKTKLGSNENKTPEPQSFPELAEMKESIDELRKQYLKDTGSAEARTKVLTDELRRVSAETQTLCNTLRGKATVQGTWGEEMLTRILETAGLMKGVHYDEQYQVVDGSGKKLYPDVVIHLSGGRNLVVDSKVSLEQFLKSNEEENVTRQKQALKAHVTSVRFHVSELVNKDYQHLVPNSLDYILMFMPHEGAFSTAVAEDPSLLSWAYSQNVIIVNPSNLMTTLLLVKNLWQQEERAANVEKINEAAIKLYAKFVQFAKNFEKIDAHLDKARSAYDAARKQLNGSSKGIVAQLEAWEENYGIRTSEPIPETLK